MKTKRVIEKEKNKVVSVKLKCKNKQRSGTYAGREQSTLLDMRHEWRHKFIAYCQLRGRALDEIEPKCRVGNEPDQNLVDKFKEEFTRDVE